MISTTTASVHMTLNMIDAFMGEQDVPERNEQAVDIHRPVERFKRRRERKKKLQALTDEDKDALRKASTGCLTGKMIEGYLREGEGDKEKGDKTDDDDSNEDENKNSNDDDNNDDNLDESNEKSNRKIKSTGSGEEQTKNFRTKHDPNNWSLENIANMTERAKEMETRIQKLQRATRYVLRIDRQNKLTHGARMQRTGDISRILLPKLREMPEGYPFIQDPFTMKELRKCRNND